MKREKNLMTLPKSKSRKLINKEKFVKLAEKVRQSFEDQEKYLREKREKNGANNTAIIY